MLAVTSPTMFMGHRLLFQAPSHSGPPSWHMMATRWPPCCHLPVWDAFCLTVVGFPQ